MDKENQEGFCPNYDYDDDKYIKLYETVERGDCATCENWKDNYCKTPVPLSEGAVTELRDLNDCVGIVDDLPF